MTSKVESLYFSPQINSSRKNQSIFHFFPGCSLQVSSVTGTLLWSLKWDSDRPISAIKCCPKNKNFAVGDNSGRIRVYKDSTKESFSQAHWHSLPIQALQFSQDGVHLYSGGHEGKN